jgi:hypothetical protein
VPAYLRDPPLLALALAVAFAALAAAEVARLGELPGISERNGLPACGVERSAAAVHAATLGGARGDPPLPL